MFGTYRLFLAFLVLVTHIGHIEVVAGLAVWGFFMLSGYLITGVLQTRYGFTREGLLTFAISRVLRLYPAYWCVALISFAVTAWFRTDVNPQLVNTAFAPLAGFREWVSAAFVISHTNLGIGRVEHALVPPIWAVDVEIVLYLMSCFVVSRSRRAAKISMIVSLLLFPFLWVAARMLIHAGDIDTAGQLLYSFIPAALLPYSIGAHLFFATPERGGLAARISVPASIGIPIAVAALFFIALVVSRYSNTFSYVASLPVLAYLVVVLSGIRNLTFKALADFLGLMSYPMYLAHYLCAYVAAICFRHFSYAPYLIASAAGPTYRYTILGFGVISCLTLLFSAALAFWLERPIERVRRSIAVRLAAQWGLNR